MTHPLKQTILKKPQSPEHLDRPRNNHCIMMIQPKFSSATPCILKTKQCLGMIFLKFVKIFDSCFELNHVNSRENTAVFVSPHDSCIFNQTGVVTTR